MRRALLVALVATPLVVLAAVSVTTAGQLLETTNFNSTASTSYINAAQCADSTTSPKLNLEWMIHTATGVSFSGGGTYTVYASTSVPAQTTPTDGGGAGIYCATTDAPSATPAVFADSVGSVTADVATKDLAVSGNDAVVKAANKSCDPSQENQQIWICAHWLDSSGKTNGYASGKFTLQLKAPNQPTNVSVGAGDSKLKVSWTAPDTSNGAANPDHYIAQATPVGGGTTVYSDSVIGTTNATITGLSNGSTYDVRVVAYSIGGNPSTASDPAAQGTPAPSADFWDVYRDSNGVEEGGCSSGGAGAFALLGVASLLRLRRRNP